MFRLVNVIMSVLVASLVFTLPLSQASAKAIFVKATADQSQVTGDGTKKDPFNTLLVKPVGAGMGIGDPGDNILVMSSEHSLQGGVTLQDGQKLQGFNSGVCQPSFPFECDTSQPLGKITNDGIDNVNGGSGVVLANNNKVAWLYIHDVARGYGILGDNVTGSDINHVLLENITEFSTSNIFGRVQPNCDIDNDIYRACIQISTYFFTFIPFTVTRSPIAIYADDAVDFPLVNGVHTTSHSIKNSTIRGSNYQVQAQVAGTTKLDLNMENVSLEGGALSTPGRTNINLILRSMQSGVLEATLTNVRAINALLEGIAAQIGFNYRFGNPNIPPISDGELILNYDFVEASSENYGVFYLSAGAASFEHPLDPTPAGSLTARIQNSKFNRSGTDPARETLFFNTRFMANANIDLGCVEDCPPGASVGNNHIEGGLSPSIFESGVLQPLAFVADGAHHIKAENNYWGTEDGLTCFNLLFSEISGGLYSGPNPPADPSAINCLLYEGATIDAVPFLSAPPDLGF